MLWLFDGDSFLSPALVGLSGDRSAHVPTNIVSSGQYMYVRFTSDDTGLATGFSAGYQSLNRSSVTGACNELSRPEELLNFAGTISSPYFQDPYPMNCYCEWLITATVVTGYVRLDFLAFVTQANVDWVVLYDGASASSSMLARLSGQYSPAPTGFVTSQRRMFVRFSSSEQFSLAGWRASYETVIGDE
jgi:hypothetical protein